MTPGSLCARSPVLGHQSPSEQTAAADGPTRGDSGAPQARAPGAAGAALPRMPQCTSPQLGEPRGIVRGLERYGGRQSCGADGADVSRRGSSSSLELGWVARNGRRGGGGCQDEADDGDEDASSDEYDAGGCMGRNGSPDHTFSRSKRSRMSVEADDGACTSTPTALPRASGSGSASSAAATTGTGRPVIAPPPVPAAGADPTTDFDSGPASATASPAGAARRPTTSTRILDCLPGAPDSCAASLARRRHAAWPNAPVPPSTATVNTREELMAGARRSFHAHGTRAKPGRACKRAGPKADKAAHQDAAASV
uniref:Uncharacterized protein n=1 Tax=Cafeteria roenbergensis TaxID=33653 RepID=A0A7S0K5L6_CAFRO|mmetsp:Transcript_5884/g.24777  ORF Transcript_5884/g.24777 Transcript_5884/m.24777 type:complete len:311 (+) Transcript_5884:1305-2237(+)